MKKPLIAGLVLIPLAAEALHATAPEDGHVHQETAEAPTPRAVRPIAYSTTDAAWPDFTLDLTPR